MNDEKSFGWMVAPPPPPPEAGTSANPNPNPNANANANANANVNVNANANANVNANANANPNVNANVNANPNANTNVIAYPNANANANANPNVNANANTNANPNANTNAYPIANANTHPNVGANTNVGTGRGRGRGMGTDDTADASVGPIGLLLRNPSEVARRCLDEEDLRALTLASLAALVVGAAVFGGVVGSFRGGVQIAYGATKVPLAMVAALVVCVPAFHAIAASLGRPWPLRTVIALTVTAAGRAALVLLAFAPVLWLAYDLGLGYHAAALAATLAYVVAGLAALGIVLRGLGQGPHRLTTAAAFVACFLAAAGQTGWMLRPYLVRPRTEEVPFVRAREGGFGDALFVSARSALGVYDRARDVASHELDVRVDSASQRVAPACDDGDCYRYSPPDGAYR